VPRELSRREGSHGCSFGRAVESFGVIKNTHCARSTGGEADRVRYRDVTLMVEHLDANRRDSQWRR
jgi:hypothetical protein